MRYDDDTKFMYMKSDVSTRESDSKMSPDYWFRGELNWDDQKDLYEKNQRCFEELASRCAMIPAVIDCVIRAVVDAVLKDTDVSSDFFSVMNLFVYLINTI